METVEMSVTDLRSDPRNARLHPEQQILALMESLSRFGQRRPVVTLPDGMIVAGHGTVEAAKRLGWSSVIVAPWEAESEREAAAFAIADNQTALMSAWDEELLPEVLGDLEDDWVAGLFEEIPADDRDDEGVPGGGYDEDGDDLSDGVQSTSKQRDEAPESVDAAGTKVVVGTYRFDLSRAEFLAWQDAIRQAVGFEERSVEAEIRRRLGL